VLFLGSPVRLGRWRESARGRHDAVLAEHHIRIAYSSIGLPLQLSDSSPYTFSIVIQLVLLTIRGLVSSRKLNHRLVFLAALALTGS